MRMEWEKIVLYLVQVLITAILKECLDHNHCSMLIVIDRKVRQFEANA